MVGRVWVVSICLFIVNLISYAANPGDVVINEIAWMGTSSASSADEWIELLNVTSSSINITGWTLSATDGTPGITLSGSIPGMGYFLQERTDETTVNDITSNQIYTGSMSNSGENLELRDAVNQLIDQVNCGGGWFAGNSSTYSSMERIDPLASGNNAGNWGTNDGLTRNGLAYDNDPINGTPKAENSVFESSLSVSLSEFYVIQSLNVITLHWSTESEVNSIGFNIYRSAYKDGPFTLMTHSVIQSHGNSSIRHNYSWDDKTVRVSQSYWYRLEEIDQYGIKTTLDEIQVIVQEAKLPKKSGLLPNYPNPFNPDTIIRYSVSDEQEYAHVQIAIYDVLGCCVNRLVNRFQSPGQYIVQWGGLDINQQRLPGGIYFCRLIIENVFFESIKMMKLD